MAIQHKSKAFGGYKNTSLRRPTRSVASNAVGKPGIDPATLAAVTGSPAPDPFAPGPDAAYLAALGANTATYANILAQLPGLLSSAAADYGYTVNYTPGARDAQGNVDPNDPNSIGTYSIGGIDPNNPNSRAAALQRAYQNQQRGNTNSYAARGQGYSGALQNAQNDATTTYGANEAANERSFANLISGYFNNAGSARTNALTGNASAVGDLANRMAATPAPSTVTYAGAPYTPADAANGQPFAAPVGTPTVASVLASKSLLGTDITKKPPASYYKPKKAKGS